MSLTEYTRKVPCPGCGRTYSVYVWRGSNGKEIESIRSHTSTGKRGAAECAGLSMPVPPAEQQS